MDKSLGEKWANHSSGFWTLNEWLQNRLHGSFRIYNTFSIQDFADATLLAVRKYLDQKFPSYFRKYLHFSAFLVCLQDEKGKIRIL